MARRQVLLIAALAAVAGVLLFQPGQAQQARQQKFEMVGGQGVFNLSELGAVLIENDSILTFVHAMERAARPAAYREVDVQTGDTLVMVNGKRVHTVAMLKDLYDKLEVGGTLKLGLRRGKDLILATLIKGDPAKMPQMKMQISNDEGGQPQGDVPAGAQMMILDDSDPNILPMLDLGLVLKQSDRGLEIGKVLPNAAEIFGGTAPAAGAVITALNGVSMKTAAEFKQAFTKLKPGDKMTLDYRRGGDEMAVVLVVPEETKVQMWKSDKK